MLALTLRLTLALALALSPGFQPCRNKLTERVLLIAPFHGSIQNPNMTLSSLVLVNQLQFRSLALMQS